MNRLFYSEHRSPGGNANTDALRRLFGDVKNRKPVLWACPARDPFPADPRIKAIRFSGLPCRGKETEVFAYIGFPADATPETPAPGMVLVHGGAGHAYAEWVRDWVNHGFAAISFDGFGQTYLGPDHSYDADLAAWGPDPAAPIPMDGFATRGKPFAEQGYTYYAADVILAHTLLRSDPRTDPARIGLTGISWGGFAAGTVIGYDDRFAFAAPVYGCGFQDISQTVWGEGFRGEGISDVWDAKLLLGEVKMPVHWFNGDGDPFFDAASATASAAASPKGMLTLLPGFTHGQIEGSSIPELFRFAEEQTGRGQRNLRLGDLRATADGAAFSVSLPPDARNPAASVFYKTEDLIYAGEENGKHLREAWKRAPGEVRGGTARLPIPAEARIFYFCATGETAEGTLRASTGVFRRGAWPPPEDE